MTDHGLSGPNARSIIQDSFGNIWIGNYRGGVDFISYAQPLFNTIAYTIEKQGHRLIINKYGDYGQIINRQIWLGGEGELGIYKERKENKKLLFTRMPAAPTNTYQCDLPRQTRTTCG